MKNLVILSLFSLLIATAYCEIHAVIVAGSNGYWNYRHQADACHAYQTLLQKGVNPQNIILMSYNDAASSSENPFPNQLFNAPSPNKPGWDVNKGCVIDYEGEAVNPENYIAVITGNSSAVKGGNGRVLQSGPNDHVFLNFVDHGGVGLIGFPTDFLYADDLLKALEKMHSQKMYQQLTYYMEACESGSMFQNLSKSLNIYAVTAANAHESSWGCYCDSKVNGVAIDTCLGDTFSVNWMQDTDAVDTNEETLSKQFSVVKNLTNQSHVMKYGDFSFIKEEIAEFLGDKDTSKLGFKLNTNLGLKRDSRDIQHMYLLKKFLKTRKMTDFKKMKSIMDKNARISSFFNGMMKKFGLSMQQGSPENINFDCLKKSVSTYEENCGKFTEFGLKFVKVLANACDMNLPKKTLYEYIQSHCSSHIKKQMK